MSDRLRIGMIGCGEIAVQTARGIAAAGNAEIAFAMDVHETVARDLGETYQVPWTTRVEDLLASPSVDAVYVAVPHYLHAPLTVQALQAGKQVLVEKPIATTLEDADTMIRTAREAGLVLSVAFQAQVDPAMQRVRQIIADGVIGEVVGTRIVLRSDKPASYWQSGYSGRVQTDWRVSKSKAGGGVLIMNTIHDLNTLRFLTGLEVTRVYAEYDTFSTPVEVEDCVALTYRYANGAIGTLEAGSAIRGRDPLREVNRIYGQTGQILLESPPRIFVTAAVAGFPTGEWQALPVPERERGADRRAIIEGFARAVLDGAVPPVRGEDGRAALEIVLAAYQSGQSHQPVRLPFAR